MIEESVEGILASYINADGPAEDWDWEGLQTEFGSTFFLGCTISADERAEASVEGLREQLLAIVREAYQRRIDAVGEEIFREVEKSIALRTIDTCWQEHLHEIDELRDGIGFVGVGGKNPLIEYKRGAYDMFESLIGRIAQETLRNLFQLRIAIGPEALGPAPSLGRINAVHQDATNMGFRGVESAPTGGPSRPAQLRGSGGGSSEGRAVRQPVVRNQPKVGRNAPCPCGSGKKYKRCHGINA